MTQEASEMKTQTLREDCVSMLRFDEVQTFVIGQNVMI